MSKQDRQGIRNFNDMEYRYKIEKRFSEITVIAGEARIIAKRTEDNVKAELELTIKKDENDKIVSMLNASAEVITLKGNRISIESDNFTLTGDGTVTAKAGKIGGCEIINGVLTIKEANADGIKAKNVNIAGEITATKGVLDNCEIKETCTIKGKLTGNTISSHETDTGAKGSLSFFTTDTGAYYDFNFSLSPFASGIRLGLNSWGGGNPSVYIYSEESNLVIGDKISANALGNIELSAGTDGYLTGGTWHYKGEEIATKTDFKALDERLKMLEGA